MARLKSNDSAGISLLRPNKGDRLLPGSILMVGSPLVGVGARRWATGELIVALSDLIGQCGGR